jgi:hypothetical protein
VLLLEAPSIKGPVRAFLWIGGNRLRSPFLAAVVAEELGGAAVEAELLSLSRPAMVAGGKGGARRFLFPLALQKGGDGLP